MVRPNVVTGMCKLRCQWVGHEQGQIFMQYSSESMYSLVDVNLEAIECHMELA